MQTIYLPLQEIESTTKDRFKTLSVHERINLKLSGLRQLHTNGKTAPAMYVLTCLINQHHYVVSGACKRNSDRYERENRHH